MKKLLLTLAAMLAAGTLVCHAQAATTVKVGASPTPHAEILEFVQDNLAAEAAARGIEAIGLQPGDDLVQLVADAVAGGADGLAAAGGDGTQALVATFAAANDLPDPVDEDVKQERLARFMERQAAISEARLAAKVGSVQQVIVDAIDGELAIARSMADAPEIDGLVQVQDGREAGLAPGDFAFVRIMGSDEHDLYGEVDYNA